MEEQFRILYNLCDTDHDGQVRVRDIRTLLLHSAEFPLPEEVKKELDSLLTGLDVSETRLVEFSDFCDVLSQALQPSDGPVDELTSADAAEADELSEEDEAKIRAIFEHVDKSGRGSITREDAYFLFKELGGELSAQEAADLLASIDADGSGEIDYAEFIPVGRVLLMHGFTLAKLIHSASDAAAEPGAEQPRAKKQHTFSAEQVAQFKLIFDFVDADSSGFIEADELYQALRQLGRAMPLSQVEELMNELDDDGNGAINFDEFITGIGSWFLETNQQIETPEIVDVPGLSKAEVEEIKMLFTTMDTDNSGFLSPDEIYEVLQRLGKNITKDDLAKFLDQIDQDGNGEISAAEFLEGMARLQGLMELFTMESKTKFESSQDGTQPDVEHSFSASHLNTALSQQLNQLELQVDRLEKENFIFKEEKAKLMKTSVDLRKENKSLKHVRDKNAELQQTVDRQTEDIAVLTRQLEKLRKWRRELEGSPSSRTNSRRSGDQAATETEKHGDNLKVSATIDLTRKRELDELSSDLDLAQSNLAESLDKQLAQTNEILALKSRLQSCEAAADEYRSLAEQQQAELAELRLRAAAGSGGDTLASEIELNAQQQQAYDAVRADKLALEQKLADALLKAEVARAQQAEYVQLLEAARSSEKQLAAAVASLKSALAAEAASAEATAASIAERDSTLAELRSRDTAHAAELSQLRAALQAETTSHAATSQRLQDVRQLCDELRNQAFELGNQLNSAQAQLASEKHFHATATASADELDKALQQAKQGNAALAAELHALRTAHEQADESALADKRKLDGVEARLSQLADSESRLRRELEQARAELQASNSELAGTTAQLGTAQAALAAEAAGHAFTRTRLESLQGQLGGSSDALATAQAELEAVRAQLQTSTEHAAQLLARSEADAARIGARG
eukprot:TRINITY_DN5747_c0_g1_i2.p1 TRINITY_DN5747_c0_g1~~TRINITY_DN5747_c0_g1_i2.p1  ORF type:complete len:920 (+),score=392.19 TRINITY_DN5747_c0_g1_i2:4128-6887(+)